MLSVIRSLFFACSLLVAFTSFAQDQKAQDETTLKNYFAANKIKATRTASGLYYVILKKGSGENAKRGQKVSVNYLGKFLDGKVFDGNIDDNYKSTKSPINFTVGVGQVIPGWDEGLQLISPGTRAVLYIPSGLAYGPGGRGPIPPNSILMFNVELLSAQ